MSDCRMIIISLSQVKITLYCGEFSKKKFNGKELTDTNPELHIIEWTILSPLVSLNCLPKLSLAYPFLLLT